MADTNKTDSKRTQKRTAAKKQAVLGLVTALSPIVVERLLTGVDLASMAVTDTAAAVQGVLGVVAVAVLLAARYVYEIEQLPDEVSVGLILRVTGRIAKALTR
jgi:uncharacterized membrane protein YqjE